MKTSSKYQSPRVDVMIVSPVMVMQSVSGAPSGVSFSPDPVAGGSGR